MLVVEDEQKVANALREGLEGEKLRGRGRAHGRGCLLPDDDRERSIVILLDLGLPGRDGLQILTTLREQRDQDAGARAHRARHAAGSRCRP